LEKITSTWDAEFTHGTSSESIRCCHAPELIDSKPVWDKPSVNLMEKSPELKLDQFCTQLDLINNTLNQLWKPSEEPRTNSQEDKKLSFQTSGDSLNWPDSTSKRDGPKELLNQMDVQLDWSDQRDHLLPVHSSTLPEVHHDRYLKIYIFIFSIAEKFIIQIMINWCCWFWKMFIIINFNKFDKFLKLKD